MGVEVAELADDIHGQRRVRDKRIAGLRSWRGRSVGEVGDESTTEDPVVRAVLEDVAHGHRSQAETVDEDRLQLTLEEVKCDHEQAEGLEVGRFGRGIGV